MFGAATRHRPNLSTGFFETFPGRRLRSLGRVEFVYGRLT
jgi:hypothetical protein